MYSNSKKGFSILELLVKIIFAALFIFILIWLFNKKIPKVNMDPFYSNVFRENIKYMQDAGESYFTDDKMPQEIGESVKLTLAEMESRNMILPFVDKDGKECNKNDSFVSITKMSEGYELKTNLVCSSESKFITKTLGCHTYCENGNCAAKKCTVPEITQYQFKKLVNGTKTNYSCNKGYTLKGKYCYKTTLKDSKDASVTTTETTTYKKPATAVTGDSVTTLLKTVVKTSEVALTVVKKANTTTSETTVAAIKSTKEESYDCKKTKTENKCTSTPVSEAYSCDCGTRYVNGMPKYTCNTCYRTVQQTTCKDVKVEYTGTCTRSVDSYTCPSGTTRQTGSGSGLKCYKSTSSTSYTYSCPDGTTRQTGSGSSLKCYKSTTTYSCPSGTDTQTGSGANLKCYSVQKGSVTYKCTDSGYKLDSTGKTCVKTVNQSSTKQVCKDKGYKLENGKCNLYETAKVKATAKKVKTSYYTYKWSDQETLAGYTRTGKTKTVKGKEVCE